MEKKYILGAIDSIKVADSDDLYLVGPGKGLIKIGDEVTLVNPGDDDKKQPIVTNVKEVSVVDKKDWIEVESAADCLMGIRLTACDFKAVKGSVVYCGDVSEKDIQDTYVSALGDSYVSASKLDIPGPVLNSLSIADLSEIWRLNEWYHSTVKKFADDKEKETNRERLDRVCSTLAKKILSADVIYCVYSVETGAPYLFSKTAKVGDNYSCTAPHIRIIPAAYVHLYEDTYPTDVFEIKAVFAGADGEGIINFLGTAFYIDGVKGVEVVTEKTTIAAQALVDAPDYSKIPEKNIPITNPDAVTWMHLLGQLGDPGTDEEKLIHNLYFGFLSKALVNAKLVLPIVSTPKGDEEEGKKAVGVLIQKTNGPRPAARAYTDMKHLLSNHKDGNGVCVVPIQDIIKEFDIALNFSGYKRSGAYITADLYDRMKKITGVE